MTIEINYLQSRMTNGKRERKGKVYYLHGITT